MVLWSKIKQTNKTPQQNKKEGLFFQCEELSLKVESGQLNHWDRIKQNIPQSSFALQQGSGGVAITTSHTPPFGKESREQEDVQGVCIRPAWKVESTSRTQSK